MVRAIRKLSVIAVAMFLVVSTQCSKGPTGPAGPQLTGKMTGFAVLVDANGNQPASKLSIIVSIDSTTKQATTDANGYWYISGVETGTYDLTFSMTGYATTRLVQVQFTGGAIDSGKDVGTVYLCATPSFSVKTLSKLSTLRSDSTTVHLGVQLTDSTVSGPYSPYRVFLFFGNSSVSSSPSNYQSVSTYAMSFHNGVDTTTIKLTPATFAAAGFAAGDSVSVVAYVANVGPNNSSYLDPATGRTIYNNINSTASNVVTLFVGSDTTSPVGGSIGGMVALIAANGAQPPNLDGVLVSIDGTSLNATTSDSGAWSIQNLGAGTYNLTFFKPGYDTAHVVQVVSTGVNSKSVGTINLCQAPSFSVGDLWQSPSADTRIRLGVKLTDTTVSDVPYRVFLFFGTDSTVSSDPSTYRSASINNAMAFQSGVDSTSIILTAASASLINYNFLSGDTVYIAAYTANAGTLNSAYTDPATGRVVYTNINPAESNVIKVVVP